MYDHINPYYDEAYNCIRCGVCQSVCPVYNVEKHEGMVARGKIRLARELVEGKLELTPRLRNFIDLCLGCGACAENCPPRVKADKIVAATRAQFVQDKGLPFIFNIALRWVMNNPSISKAAFSSLGLARNISINKLFPENIKQMEKLIPDLPQETFWEKYKKHKPLRSEKKVGYFVGCMTNLVYPQVGMAVIKVLERYGYEVVIPKAYCCGIPHYVSGDIETAKELAHKNVEIFLKSNVDVILTDCGSCGGTLIEYGDLLADNAAKVFSQKVRDVSEFSINDLKVESGEKELEIKVTYHDSCHLNRKMHVTSEPRDLLRRINGVQYVELPEASWCCGGAGTFNMKQYDISLEILKRKMENILTTEANVLSVGCPSCRMQLEHGLLNFDNTINDIKHPIELLAETY